MKYVFSESLKDAYKEQGNQGIIALWARTISDTGKSIIKEHVENQKGGESMKSNKNDILMQNKVFGWIALGTGLILLIPLIMTLLDPTASINGGAGGGWDWTLGDFVVMAILIFGMASGYVLTARKVRKNRLLLGIIFTVLFLWIWVELAVGLFTNLGS